MGALNYDGRVGIGYQVSVSGQISTLTPDHRYLIPIRNSNSSFVIALTSHGSENDARLLRRRGLNVTSTYQSPDIVQSMRDLVRIAGG